VCHETRLIVEIDGGQHDRSSPQEQQRSRFLENEGYRILRFWNNDVLANLDGIHETIADKLHRITPTQTLPHRWGRALVRFRPMSAPVTPTAQHVLWLELMQFYIREAWLLDERKFKEWLDLFTDDVLYFMPRRKNVLRREAHRELTPFGDLAIFEEDKRYLEMRVARLETGMAWAEDPPSRTRHLIGNLEAAALENGEVEAKTAFLVYRSHLETDHQLLSGCREDLLRKVNGVWKVRRRTIVLDANVLLDKNLSVFL
jgi:3-phenylpropionate/cinnamic acid dioxygenase small subunit